MKEGILKLDQEVKHRKHLRFRTGEPNRIKDSVRSGIRTHASICVLNIVNSRKNGVCVTYISVRQLTVKSTCVGE